MGKANNKVNLSRFQCEEIPVPQVSTALPMLTSHYNKSFFQKQTSTEPNCDRTSITFLVITFCHSTRLVLETSWDEAKQNKRKAMRS